METRRRLGGGWVAASVARTPTLAPTLGPSPILQPHRIFESPTESPDKWEEAGLRVVQVRLRNFE